jgi:hypothetical protein
MLYGITVALIVVVVLAACVILGPLIMVLIAGLI